MAAKTLTAMAPISSNNSSRDEKALSTSERFALIQASSLEQLVEVLNNYAETAWFSIVQIQGTTAMLDLAVHPVTAVEEDYMENDKESALQGDSNQYNTKLIA